MALTRSDRKAAWDKRLRAPTLRTIVQNQSLGAHYYRLEALGSAHERGPSAEPIAGPLDILEELANRGRCVVALPDEERLALYFVEADTGGSRVVWYEPLRGLPSPTDASHWKVTLEVDPALQVVDA
jgi:hypothetical protein